MQVGRLLSVTAKRNHAVAPLLAARGGFAVDENNVSLLIRGSCKRGIKSSAKAKAGTAEAYLDLEDRWDTRKYTVVNFVSST